jgi:hypothetical protein
VRKLSKPTTAPLALYSTCVSGVKDPAQQARLTGISSDIDNAASLYELSASAACLYSVTPATLVGGTVTVKEMKDLYKEAMSSANGVARDVYSQILNATPNNICPLCGQGRVNALDHYLPQSKYPGYVVNPANLVPACIDCNSAKRAKFPRSPEEQTIHPYFDNFTQDVWLHARVLSGGPPALEFMAEGPIHWDPINKARVKRHFTVFKLARTFTAYAGSELSSIRSLLVNDLRGDSTRIRTHLEDQVRTRRDAYLNSWQAAMFAALSTDPWFLSGGFHHIPIPG